MCVSPTVKTANLLFDNMLLLQSSKPALLLPLLVLLWPPSSDSCSFTPILNFGGLGAGGCPVSCLAVCVSFSSAVDSSRHIMKVVLLLVHYSLDSTPMDYSHLDYNHVDGRHLDCHDVWTVTFCTIPIWTVKIWTTITFVQYCTTCTLD